MRQLVIGRPKKWASMPNPGKSNEHLIKVKAAFDSILLFVHSCLSIAIFDAT